MKDLRVAVLVRVSRVPGEAIDTATLTEMLQVALVDRDEFRIVERSLLDKIVKEQEFQVSGMTEGQAAKAGIVDIRDQVLSYALGGFIDVFPILADRLVRKARGETVSAYNIPADQAPASDGTSVQAVSPEGICGSYRAAGANPGGSPYEGTCFVALKGDGTYGFDWEVGESTYIGIGTLLSGVMTVDWGDSSPLIYKVQQGGKVLVATWSDGHATEKLTR